MTLHLVNKSAVTSSALARCLAIMTPDDFLLLIEDGVHNALSHGSELPDRCGVLLPDAVSRGIDDLLPSTVTTVNYDEFVALVVRHNLCQSWY